VLAGEALVPCPRAGELLGIQTVVVVWILNPEGFWDLVLRAGHRAVWDILRTGENRLRGSGSRWNVWA
jgi:hypothetical protein